MTQDMPHLLVAIDFGASATKVVASLAGGRIDHYKLLLLAPYCIDVGYSEILTPNPDFDERSCWVKIGGIYSAVGNLAQANYPAWLDIQGAKDDTAVAKTCAAIAVLVQKFKLPPSFRVTVASVLPPGELAAKDDYKTDLAAAFKDLTTPAGKIKPKLEKVNTLAEGMGVLNQYSTEYQWREKSVAVVMSGFRNTSLLLSEQGQVGVRKTSSYGYHSLLQDIEGGYATRDLIEPVIAYRMMGDASVLSPILKSAKNPERELARLIESIELARHNFLTNLTNWLKSNLPPQVDAVVLCGGTGEYIGRDLDSWLETKVRGGKASIYKCTGDGLPTAFGDLEMQSRFADIYYVWHGLHRKYQADRKVAIN